MKKVTAMPIDRLFFIAILAFILVQSCSDAPVFKSEPTDRIVLAEFFTFARCFYCPFAEHALDSLSREYSDTLAVIAYHRRWLDDTISPSYVAVRESLYQINTSPTVVFNGLNEVQTEDPDQDYTAFKNQIAVERNNASSLRLELEADVQSTLITLRSKITAVDTVQSNECRLFYIVYEDSVFFAQSGAPESTFVFVMRRMLPDAYGVPVTISFPDSVTSDMAFMPDQNWNSDKLGVIAFVQDMGTKEVLQAVIIKRIGVNR